MITVQGFPYQEVEFDKQAVPVTPTQVEEAVAMVRDHDLTDVFVLSHGWNNDMDEARRLYAGLLGVLAEALPAAPGLAGRRFGAVAVLWPSKKFAEKALIPGGAASAGDAVTDEEILEQLTALEALIDDPQASADLARARALVPDLEDRRTARAEFSRLLLAHVPTDAALEEDDPLIEPGQGDVVTELGTPALPGAPASTPGGASGIDPDAIQPIAGGGASGLGDLWTGIKAGAQHLANFVTYYQMKSRAGVVGRVGVSPLLERLAGARPDVRLHLVGHSFGGRLATAAIAGADGPARVRVGTLTLLQAAYSHFGLANDYGGGKAGAYRRVTDGRVEGPILITCTHNDRAVGLAYALASRAARQVASGIGDSGDPYGGIGANGAQRTPEAEELPLQPVGTDYALQPGRVYNLRADPYITGHSDIVKPEVAHAVLAAIATLG